jgi:tyrosyl-tRNA synthetase
MPFSSPFLQDLEWRGQIAQATDLEGLDKHLSTGPASARKAYVGFDPTADSLTIGNLVGIMALARFHRFGHTPVAIMGGGTGLIGDPSGKSAERQLRTKEEIASNVANIQTIFDRVWQHAGVPGAGGSAKPTIINNIDWLGTISYLDALRDIGKHFSVNMMIQKDSVKERLTNRDQGISYTEFSYMILQAYDYQQLHEKHGVTLQMGGSDQFGNIVVGMDLIAKKANERASEQASEGRGFGLTWPLVTKADGTKFGKTESGAIWLTAKKDASDTSPSRTSAYAYYQFWLNAADADVVRLLKTYTFLSREEVTSLEQQIQTNPGAREAQRRLAQEATRILHGDAAMQHAESAGKALFSGDVAHLSHDMLNEVFASVPTSTHAKATLEGDGVNLLDLLVTTQLAASKREAKEFLTGGSVTINGRKATADEHLKTTDLLHGEVIALRRGKKAWHVTRWH